MFHLHVENWARKEEIEERFSGLRHFRVVGFILTVSTP